MLDSLHMYYESKISILPEGTVTMTTTGTQLEKNSVIREERTTCHYPSIEELQRSLIRERRDTRLIIEIGQDINFISGIFIITALFNTEGRDIGRFLAGAFFVGGTLIAAGELLRRREKENRLQVDSKITYFNSTFPDSKIPPFRFREYLSAIKIPFIHR